MADPGARSVAIPQVVARHLRHQRQNVAVKVVGDPRWTPMMATPEGRQKIGAQS